VKYRLLKPMMMGFGSSVGNPMPTSYREYLPDTILVLDSDPDGHHNVWFRDPDGWVGKVEAGSVMNLREREMLEPVEMAMLCARDPTWHGSMRGGRCFQCGGTKAIPELAYLIQESASEKLDTRFGPWYSHRHYRQCVRDAMRHGLVQSMTFDDGDPGPLKLTAKGRHWAVQNGVEEDR